MRRYPRLQFLFIEGFGNIIDPAGSKAVDDVVPLAPRRNKDDWDRARALVLLQTTTHFKTVHLRHHHV
jgi:hypothetical protein